MRYIDLLKTATEFYDTIDFMRFIPNETFVDIGSVMRQLEDYYEYAHPELLPKEFKGCFFNFMDEGEFSEYLRQRYDFYIDSQVIEKHFIIRY